MTNDPTNPLGAVMQAWMDAQKALWTKAAPEPMGDLSKTIQSWFEDNGASGKAAQAIIAAMREPAHMFGASDDGMSHAIWSMLGDKAKPFDPSKLDATQEWAQMQTALLAMQQLLSRTWTDAFEKFRQDSDPDDGFEAAAKDWLTTSGDALEALQKTDPFLDAQAELLRCTAALKQKERALTDAWCESAGIPTRSEVDSLHESLAQLRRDLRALQRDGKNAKS